MSKGRALVTGAAGLIGSHAAEALADAGWAVEGLDDLSSGRAENLRADLPLHQVDLLDHAAIGPLCDGVDLVFHAAAHAHEGLSFFSPHAVTSSVYGATVSLASAALAGGCRRFVFCSSMARYGDGAPPFDEDSPPAPVDPYGVAKVAAEDTLRQLCAMHGAELVILVPHNVIGARQTYDDPYRNVAAIFANMMLQGRAPAIYGDGEQRRGFTPIEDLVPLFAPAAEAPAAAGEVINIGPDGEGTSINDLYAMVARLTAFQEPPERLPARPEEVRAALCTADKARALLGFEARTPLEDTLEGMIAWIRRHGPRPFRYRIDLEIPSQIAPRTWRERTY
ncbi:MAG: NAD-dependent epimerase/dehydratase family protein [Pseudomonadota bacterium]